MTKAAKRYVQHMSGTGEKWEVAENVRCDGAWGVYAGQAKHGIRELFYLPASEYRLCDPPECWEDISEKCEAVANGDWHDGIYMDGRQLKAGQGFRVRKVHLETVPPEESGAYFIVERKVSQ